MYLFGRAVTGESSAVAEPPCVGLKPGAAMDRVRTRPRCLLPGENGLARRSDAAVGRSWNGETQPTCCDVLPTFSSVVLASAQGRGYGLVEGDQEAIAQVELVAWSMAELETHGVSVWRGSWFLFARITAGFPVDAAGGRGTVLVYHYFALWIVHTYPSPRREC